MLNISFLFRNKIKTVRVVISLGAFFVTFFVAQGVQAASVYYSVGQNTTSHETGAGNVTVSGTTATFTVAQTATNMGVGDVIDYDTDNKKCYISGKTSQTVWSCTNATGGTPTSATGVVVNSISHAFNSLSAAEAGAPTLLGNSDLTAIDVQLNIPCYFDTGADTTAVTIDGYTTDATRYIKIYTPNSTTTEVNQSQRHTGKWDDLKYRLEVVTSNNGSALHILDTFTQVVGLQAHITTTANAVYGIYIRVSAKVSDCIVKSSGDGAFQSAHGIYIGCNGYGQAIQIWNCLAYSTDTTTSGTGGTGFYLYDYYQPTIILYNSTAYNYARGISGDINNNRQIIKNCISVNSRVGDDFQGVFYTGDSNNVSSDATAPGTNSLVNQTLNDIDFISTTSGSEDLHIQNTSVARNSGTDLSGTFTTDIDNQSRPGAWDIGADEIATPVFFSVGQSASNLMTGTPNVAITNGVATFTVAQTGDIGVGDVVVVGGSSYYISGKISQLIWNVTTATGSVPANISSTAVTSIGRVYTSLASAEAGAPTLLGTSDLVTANIQLNFPCYYDSGADTTAVTVGGYTTDPNNYIKIYTPSNTTTEANNPQRHSGNKNIGYVLKTITSNVSALTINSQNIIVDGLIITSLDKGYDKSGIRVAGSSGSGDIILKNNIIYDCYAGLQLGNTFDNFNLKIYNNIIYGNASNGLNFSQSGWYPPVTQVYNNTIVSNGGYGIMESADMTLVARNTISYNNTLGDFYSPSSHLTCYSCLSSDATAGNFGGSDNKINQTVSFVDATNKDFRLAETDTAARDAGANLSADANLAFNTDIQGTARGGAWDIGADEVPVDFVSSVMQSSGDYATLSAWEDAVESDLTLSTTRVFSGTLTGALAENAVVTLYRSSVSTGITGTVVAKSTVNGQILIDNISGTSTPLVAQANDQWYLNVSNYFTITGTGDQLGASPRAVAKIDGAWTVADSSTLIWSWITDEDNYIKIYTTDLARHKGKWDDSKYRIIVNATAGTQDGLRIMEDYVKVDGLQVNVINNGYSSCYAVTSGAGSSLGDNNLIEISNNIFKGLPTVNDSYGYVSYDDSSYVKIWNNIIYNFTIGGGMIVNVDTINIYNNTIYNNYYGIARNSGDIIVKNNIIAYTTDPFFGTFHTSSTNNATDINDTPSGSAGTNFINQTFSFVSTASGTEDFHLLNTDTGAKNRGADLSSDPYLKVTTDIDGASRNASINAFDIGVDETATQIFRSVDPGATTVLESDTSHARNITLTGGTATFNVALQDNVGVGDAVLIDTNNDQSITSADTLLFIQERISSTNYKLQTNNGAIPSDIAINDTYQIYRAYTSLFNAESGTKNTSIPITFNGGNRDLVTNNEEWNIAAYANGTTADTTAVTIDGWNTGAQNFIKVYTPVSTSEVGVSQRHSGKWDDGKYNLKPSATSSIAVAYTRVDGIQLQYSATNQYAMTIDSDFIVVSNNIIISKQTINSSGGIKGNGKQPTIFNNIVYSLMGGTYFLNCIYINNGSAVPSSYVYNNTVTNCQGGILNGSGHMLAKNNLVYNNSSTDYSGNFNASSTNNLSKDATAPALGTYFRNATVNFIDATNNDFHLAQSDTAARSAGANLTSEFTSYGLPVANDIDNQLRNPVGAGWDIGADEGTVEFTPTVMQTGGDYSTLSSWETGVQTDLVVGTTRVFAHGGKTGTIADNASVTGLTSNATATVIHATTTQILVENINGIFQVGEVVQVTAGNSVTISDNGNPASAVAKIEGAWSAADTTAVTIDGWNTGADNYIKVYTTNFARHRGKWSDDRYRLNVAAGTTFALFEKYSVIDGLQIYRSAGGFASLQTYFTDKVVISNNIIREPWSTGIVTTGDYISVINNIVYGAGGTGISIWLNNFGSTYAYNNTVYDCQYGFLHSIDSAFVAVNNISVNNSGFNYRNTSYSALSSNNISSDGYAPGTNSKINTTVNFISTIAGAEDFHLSSLDTVARNSGVDLSADANLSVTTDIDGQTRNASMSAFDIGADETATQIFRSVGPGATGLLESDTSHARTITVTNGIASFAEAMAAEVGVGDAVLIDTNNDQSITSSDTLLFISSRNSSTSYNLQTNNGATPSDIPVNDTYQIYRAYTSLANAEAGTKNTSIPVAFNGGNRDLVANNEQWNIACYGDGLAVDSRVTISGWTTGIENLIKIYTPVSSNEVGISQRHNGRWESGKYTVNSSTLYANINAGSVNFEVEGIQFYKYDSDTYSSVIDMTSPAKVKISSNIFKGDNRFNNAYGITGGGASSNISVINNIFQDFALIGGSYFQTVRVDDGNWNIFNNTFYNCNTGISRAAGDAVVKNNITQNCVNGYSGTFNASSDFNISNLAADAPGANSKNSTTVQFANAAIYDFHLSSSDTSARNAGTSLANDSALPFDTDIDGQQRTGTWSIGADDGPGVVVDSPDVPSGSKVTFQATQTDKLTDGLVGMWSFDGSDVDLPSNTAFDRSGSGNNGTISGATPAIGKKGSAMGFDASLNQYISTTKIFDPVFTYVAWINLSSASAVRVIVGPSGSGDPLFGVNTNRTLILQRSGFITIGSSTGTIPLNSWNHVAVSYNSSTGDYIFYINGVAVGNGNNAISFSLNTTLRIGARLSGNLGFQGKIDEVRMYNRVLSEGEIVGLYDLGKTTIKN